MAQIGVPGAPTIPAHALSGAIAAAAFRTALGLALDPAHQEVACSRAFDPRVRPCRILWIQARLTAALSMDDRDIVKG
jgi:hypothetical protein